MWKIKRLGSVLLASFGGMSTVLWAFGMIFSLTSEPGFSPSDFPMCFFLTVFSLVPTYLGIKFYKKPAEDPEDTIFRLKLNRILGRLFAISGGFNVFIFGAGLMMSCSQSVDPSLKTPGTILLCVSLLALGIFLFRAGQKLRGNAKIALQQLVESEQAAKFAPARDAAPVKVTAFNKRTPKMLAVTCEACGAPNKVEKGTVGECQYCGTYIQG